MRIISASTDDNTQFIDRLERSIIESDRRRRNNRAIELRVRADAVNRGSDRG